MKKKTRTSSGGTGARPPAGKRGAAQRGSRRKKGSESVADARVIALVAQEEFFLRDELASIERELFGDRGAGPSLFEVDLKKGENPPELSTVLDDLHTPSLFGGRKLVVLRGVDALDKEGTDRLLRGLEHVPSSITVVLQAEKLRRSSRLEKLVERVGFVRRFKTLYDTPGPWQRGAAYDHELSRWIVERAEKRGLRLSLVDAHRLGTRVGNHPARLESELEKLALHVEPGEPVPSDLITALAPDNREFRIFDLSDAIADRDRRRALTILDAILAEGMVGFDRSRLNVPAAIGSILTGTLRQKLGNLLRARDGIDGGRPRDEVLEELRVPPFLRARVAAQLRNYTTDELRRALGELVRFDLEMKGGSAEPEASLAGLVLGITGTGE